MHSVSSQPPAYRVRVSLPGRAVALLLALAMSTLLVLMLLGLGALPSGPPDEGSSPIVVQLLEAATGKKAPQQQPPARAPTRSKPVPLPPVPPVIVPNAKLNILVLSPEDFAASDISRFPRSVAPGPASPDAAAGGGGDESVGRGPSGERLYNAEWYREPTNAEMATYLPSSRPEGGWGMIACRTVERYRVEDCQELGESPPGSGLSRAVRLASWQFLVRPPRVGGKTMVGEWVRIRFDFKQEKRTGQN